MEGVWHAREGHAARVKGARDTRLCPVDQVSVVDAAERFLQVTACPPLRCRQILVEVVSAFSTTGFSVGASAEMNVPAKLIMVFTMLAGRIGPVTLMTSLIIRKNHNSDKNRILPEGNILVG